MTRTVVINRPVTRIIEIGRGATGASAYEVAIAGGFVGTEAEWLDSLQGAARQFWTPTPTPIVAPAPFDPTTLYGPLTLSNSNYTATGSGGFVFTGKVLPHDATLRGHCVSLDVTGVQDSEAVYIAAVDGESVQDAVNGQIFILLWNAGNGNFDVLGGNVVIGSPTALGSMSYTNGQELYFGNDSSGNISLYLDGVLQFTMVVGTPMTDPLVSFGVYHATSTSIQSTIVQNPVNAVPAITQYTSTIPGPVTKPVDREGKIYEIEGVDPGGIVVDSYLLKNGMWVEFDQNGDIVPALELTEPYLTQPVADTLYAPFITHFYGQMAAPGVNDDATSIGAMVGSKWQDVSVTPNEWYLCSDPTDGAAQWEQLSLTVDELGSMALQAAGSGPAEYRDNAAQDAAIESGDYSPTGEWGFTTVPGIDFSVTLGGSDTGAIINHAGSPSEPFDIESGVIVKKTSSLITGNNADRIGFGHYYYDGSLVLAVKGWVDQVTGEAEARLHAHNAGVTTTTDPSGIGTVTIEALGATGQIKQLANYVKKQTVDYATLLTAFPPASNAGMTATVSGLSSDGDVEVISNGSEYAPVGGLCLMARMKGLPVVKAPTFTGTSDGAITLGTALNSTFAKCFMYFPANTLVASHTAGFYYTEMSDTTNGVAYNNTYTPAVGVHPIEPVSKTAFSGAVPGGTGSTATIDAFKYSTPANALGLYGALVTDIGYEYSNTAGNKTVAMAIGGTVVHTSTSSTTASVSGYGYFRNTGAANRQRASVPWLKGATGTASLPFAINTTAAMGHSITLRTVAATDHAALVFLSSKLEK